jgi:hypothetical protein
MHTSYRAFTLRRLRSLGSPLAYVVAIVMIMYILIRPAPQDSADGEFSVTHLERDSGLSTSRFAAHVTSAVPIDGVAPTRFVVDVAKRRKFHKWADELQDAHGRGGMGHTGNVPDQSIVLAALIRKHAPDARIVCELGMNIGHSAATMLTALPNPSRYVAWDLGDSDNMIVSIALDLEPAPDAPFFFSAGSIFCVHCRLSRNCNAFSPLSMPLSLLVRPINRYPNT